VSRVLGRPMSHPTPKPLVLAPVEALSRRDRKLPHGCRGECDELSRKSRSVGSVSLPWGRREVLRRCGQRRKNTLQVGGASICRQTRGPATQLLALSLRGLALC